MTADDVVGQLSDGMTIGIGGWGSRRKPMDLVKAIARSDLKGLTVVSYGGPDVGLLCATGKVEHLVFGFVSLDSIPLEPHFRKARQAGRIHITELDEGMLRLGLQAAAWGVPFLPTRAGLGSGVLQAAPDIRTVTCPYTDAELVAMPALHLDAALIHVHRADARGNGQILSPDPFFDDLFAAAADKTFLSTEQVGLELEHGVHTVVVDRMFTRGVVHAPGGAWFTECIPDYPRDEELQRAYAAAAKTPEAWAAFAGEHL
ncbi:MAG: CoA transferase subunit A [Proteobacteria bacterium]|nr:CoA transferase subunit A [Pseudomonadota bacterium]MCP4922106.1 CoA transferase subunit A [Pseudomonadota bacterium]